MSNAKAGFSAGVVSLGNHLFRWRKFFYFIPVVLLVVTGEDARYFFGNYAVEEFFEFLSFVVLLSGLGIRFWASGSSGRLFVKKDKRLCVRFGTAGIFSLMRNPFFAGEILIAAGLSLLLFHAGLTALSLLLFIAAYLPIAAAREQMLLDAHPLLYGAYRKKVGWLMPQFSSWRKSKARFRWLVAIQKEGGHIVTMTFLFLFLEQFREIEISGNWNSNPLWIVLAAPFVLLFFALRALEPQLRRSSDVYTVWDD